MHTSPGLSRLAAAPRRRSMKVGPACSIATDLVIDDGYIYTSTNAGTTWSQRRTQHAWISVASSADGSRLAALIEATAGIMEPSGTYLELSADFGAQWAAQGGFDNSLGGSIASSSDGTKLVLLIPKNGRIYTSTNSGTTWTTHDSNPVMRSVVLSADGSMLVGVGSYVYTSTDSGSTWTERGSYQSWRGVASSSDGVRLVAAASADYLYTSVEGGINWTPRGSARQWTSVASSADGTKLVAVANPGYIYTSSGPLP